MKYKIGKRNRYYVPVFTCPRIYPYLPEPPPHARASQGNADPGDVKSKKKSDCRLGQSLFPIYEAETLTAVPQKPQQHEEQIDKIEIQGQSPHDRALLDRGLAVFHDPA